MTNWKSNLASLKPLRGWLLDVYASDLGEMTVWIIAESGERLRLTDKFQPKIYVSGNMVDLFKLSKTSSVLGAFSRIALGKDLSLTLSSTINVSPKSKSRAFIK